MLPAEIQSAVDAESFQRGLAWHARAPDLCGCPVLHYTPRMRLDLELAGNAFALLRPVRRSDVFAFLWRLNPAWRVMPAPIWLRWTLDSSLLPRVCWAVLAFRALRAALAYRALERHVAQLDLSQAIDEILKYRRACYKDRPAGRLEDSCANRLMPKPQPHWCDDLVEFFARRHGRTRDEVLDAPFAQLYQTFRAWALATGEADVIDETAALASNFASRALEQHYAAAARMN